MVDYEKPKERVSLLINYDYSLASYRCLLCLWSH